MMFERKRLSSLKSLPPKAALGLGIAAGFAFLAGLALGMNLLPAGSVAVIFFIALIAISVGLLLSQ